MADVSLSAKLRGMRLPGGYNATVLMDAADTIERLRAERDEARNERDQAFNGIDVERWQYIELATRFNTLRALLREWRDLDPLGPPPSESLLDRTDAALEGRDG